MIFCILFFLKISVTDFCAAIGAIVWDTKGSSACQVVAAVGAANGQIDNHCACQHRDTYPTQRRYQSDAQSVNT
jgi:hypothetical protein